ncbi:hypothetical protein ADILRU_1515 [Leifsonia rubra CMS 76R]|nr:hypothetical protein ADILRU_1515 [Leifsonia rubra CMS 76R]
MSLFEQQCAKRTTSVSHPPGELVASATQAVAGRTLGR